MAVTLADGLKAVQDGSAYKPPPSVNGLTNFGLSTATSAAENITGSWGAATENLSTTLSVTKSKVTLIGLKAKSEGREPTTEELDEACGPLEFLANAGKELDEVLGGIFSQVEEFASEFGESIGEFATKLNGLIADVANAVDEIAQEIAEVALAAFEAANAVAIAALEAVEGAINAAVGFVNDAIASAEALLNDTINELLAFSDSLNFASIFSLDCQKEAVENAVDTDKIAGADEVASAVGPEVVKGSGGSETYSQLAEPQTTFAPAPSTAPPPDIQTLIVEYRRAAKAFDASVEEVRRALSEGRRSSITRAQQDELDLARREALQRVREAAAAAGIDDADLAIHGRPNYDGVKQFTTVKIGRDRNGDTIYTQRSTVVPRTR